MTHALAGLAVIGGGPAGLMAAEVARSAGIDVDLYEAKSSVGRKFLVAGKGGLNVTHSEPLDDFAARYAGRTREVRDWLDQFDADALRAWARELGVETFVGSSGRIFPMDLKAAPLLRAWVRRLREAGVRFHVQHRWRGWDAAGALRFDTPAGEFTTGAAATLLALGGGSWPRLGSDGTWVKHLQDAGVDVAPLLPANCGFDIAWSAHFSNRFGGHPIKPAWLTMADTDGLAEGQSHQGEFVITGHGIEGSLVYKLAPALRQRIEATGSATVLLDLAPGRSAERLLLDLSRPRNGRSTSEILRRSAGLGAVQVGLLYERVAREDLADVATLVRRIKQLPLVLDRPRPIAEAISSAGGVRLEALDDGLMCSARPGLFCAGEMLDWEAPTGGYLLAASMASGRVAGRAASEWLHR